jgi:hypothetical protein
MSQDDIDDYNLVRFVFDLRKEDALGTVVRAQTHIECELRRFIESRAASPKYVKYDELDLGGMARLALILGLDDELKPALSALGALRNKFARSLDAKFGQQEANNFYNSLGPNLKSLMREIYSEFRMKENLPEFKRQAPLDRLIWFLVGIWSEIFADRKQAPETYRSMPKMPKGYLEGLKERQSAFFELLEGNDDLGMIIQAHIHLEYELREFVRAAAPRPTEVRQSDYDYTGTLRLALTLGLDPTLEAGLLAVGALRNKFAHRLEMRLTEYEAKEIYSKLSTKDQADSQQAYSAALLVHPNSGRPKELLRTTPKDLIATCIVTLWGGVTLGHVTLYSDALKQT